MSKGKVLLINPNLPQKTTQLNIPTSLLYLGSWLANEGYGVNILDAFNHNANKYFYNRLKEGLQDNILAVGLSVMTSQVFSAIEIARFIRQCFPDIPIVWGGIHPTLYPKQVVKSNYADFAVVGEGEIVATELLRVISNKRDNYSIKGLTYKDYGGNVIRNPDQEPIDMDLMPCPDITLLEDLRYIDNIKTIMKRVGKGLPLITSKGCPHRCTFCINSITKQLYRSRDANLVVRDIGKLLGLGVTEICFVDEDFLAHKARLNKILDGVEFNNYKFKWYGTVRADYFNDNHLNNSLLKRLKRNGCQQLGMGLESGSQRILNMIKKDITIENSLNAAKLLDAVGIDATFSFMVGIPGETPEEISKTVGLILEITKLNNSFRVLGPMVYRPLAGSELYNECVGLGMPEPETLDGWIDNPYIGDIIKPINYKLFPWVKYPMKKLVRLIFYCWMAGLKMKGFGLTQVARMIGRWRCKHMFFDIPVEMWILSLVRKLGFEHKFSRGKYH